MVLVNKMLDKPSRPPVLGGITVKVVTGCGNMYVQLNWYQGRLFEIFATLGHGGGCATCEMEALTRSITLGLKSGIPVDDYIHQLRGIRCPTPMPFPKENAVWSCPDAIAKTLSEYGRLDVGAVVKLLEGANGHKSDSGGDIASSVELSTDEVAARVRELSREREAQGLND
jgi:ribonucleoside-diphosphate reductase alpha chain